MNIAQRIRASDVVHAQMLIGGQQSGSSDRIEVSNPANPAEIVGTIARGTSSDIDRAVAAAKAAQPAWAAKSFTERAQALSRALAALEGDIAARAVLFVRENGKSLAEAEGELSSVPKRQKLTLDLAAELDEGRALDAPTGRTMIGFKPYGVVLSIVPWNSPVSLGFAQVIAALLAGNAIVLKPPETCPLALIRAAELAAGELPPGLINIVTGMPSEIGDALTSHPDIGKIGFTGSIPSARRIMANAAQTIKGITLELGGNDPAIVLEDADLSPKSMERMVRAVFRMSGQICMAIKRIYVHENIKTPFLDAFCAEVDRIAVGDGLEPNVTMGPLHTRRALERALGLVADAEHRGAHVRRLGQIPDRAVFERGYFMQPMVVTDLPDDALLMSEEQFSPVIPVATYKTLDEAFQRANATVFGLGGSVWSADVERAMQLAHRIEAGTVFVNSHGTEWLNRSAPYGGVKQSGIGRKAGLEGVLEYVQVQTLTTFE